MGRLSFFKLPLILVAFYLFFNGLIFIILMITSVLPFKDEHGVLGEYLLIKLPLDICNCIPICLLLLFISSVILYRAKVNQVTKKNIFLLMMIALILWGINFLGEIPFGKFFEIIIRYIDSPFLWDEKPMVTACLFLLTGAFTYLLINLFSKYFNHNQQTLVLNGVNSPKIHYVLFFTLFFLIASALYFFIFEVLIQDVYFPYWLFYPLVIMPQLLSIIAAILLMMSVKRRFTQTFEVLQLDRIVKSAMLANLAFFIVFVIIDVLLFIICLFFYHYLFFYHIDKDIFVALLLFMLLVQVVVGIIVIRKIVSRYFYRCIDDVQTPVLS